MHFDKVGFIGLGLIGGSIARKMKENNPKVSIIATAGHQQTIEDAFGLGLIDNNLSVCTGKQKYRIPHTA